MLGNLSNGFLGLTFCVHVLMIAAEAHAENLRVGFAQLPVTPEVVDNWVDVNNDAQFDTSSADTFRGSRYNLRSRRSFEITSTSINQSNLESFH